MNTSTDPVYTTPTARLASAALPPIGDELRSDPPPKLRIWASFPDGSRPESIEVTYDDAAPVTAELIAGILRSLEQTGNPSVEVTVPAFDLHTKESLTHAINTANRISKGMSA